VLSVGRSGSSLAARALHALGVHLGEQDELLPATPQNQDGFWENHAIYRINEEILGLLGGTWYTPPRLRAGWEHDARLSELRERARATVASLASTPASRWGFKDPRTAVLLAFWRAVAGPMHFVICVRRSQAVVESVSETGYPGAEPHATRRLWLLVNARVLAETVSDARTIVFYEDWFKDPRRVAAGLAHFVNVGEPVREEQIEAVMACFRRELRRADSPEADDAGEAPPELEAMYEHLRAVATREDGAVRLRERQARVARALLGAYDARMALRDAANRAQELADAAGREASGLRERVQQLEREQDQLRAQVQRQQTWLDGVESSASWRLTAPLRAAKRRVRR
jgi:hypothetical protein